MGDDRDRQYDMFVVRVWRELKTRRWLRAEVEHVQSGRRSERRWSANEELTTDDVVAPDATLEWIANQLDADGSPNRT